MCRSFSTQRGRISYNHYLIRFGYSAMDTNNSTSGGVDDSNMGGHTVTLHFHLRSGVCSRTFNSATAYTEDMFSSQDPELCASGPNDPQEDMS